MDAIVIQGAITLLGIALTGYFSTKAAVINSNARQAKSEQKSLDAQEQIQKELNQLKGDMTDIKGNIVELSATLNQFRARSDEFDEKLQDAFKAIAKDRISQGHRFFTLKGEITESSKESMHAIYASYKKMGGNGYVESEMKDIDSLPVV